MTAKTDSRSAADELLLTRLFDAPRQLVFDAWTRPEHLERWQGAPEGFTMVEHDVDLRPGGIFRLCMRSPDGVDHRLQGVYREIVAPERLVFTHAWLGADCVPGRETLVTITFAAEGNRTRLTLRQTGFASIGARDGHGEGWNSTLDRLGRYLLSGQPV